MSAIIQFDHVSKNYQLGSSSSNLREVLAVSIPQKLHLRKHDINKPQIIKALDDVSFEIEPGEVIGLIGPNGAGKTTTLKLLSNITYPTKGTVTITGRVSSLIELGAGFHPELTGRDNIYLYGAILGLKRRFIEGLFDSIVEFSGLESHIDTPVKRYSSGMYVRLGFSVAAHVDPDVLLVDEVLAVGDARFRKKSAKRVSELRTAGKTIVLVSHNLYLIQSVCSRAIFLDQGSLKSEGDVRSVIADYESWVRDRPTLPISLDGETAAKGEAPIQIEQIALYHSSTELIEKINYSDTFEVRISYLSRVPIEEPRIVLRIIRSDGHTACMVRTGEYGYELQSLFGGGTISIGFEPLQLAGGKYFVDVKILGALDGIPLAEAVSKWFTVSGLSLDSDESFGTFVPNVAWVRDSSFTLNDQAEGDETGPDGKLLK